MPFTERGIAVNRSIAIIGIILVGIAGMAAMVILDVTDHSDTSTVGSIVTFAGTIVAALVAYLMGAKSIEESRISQRIGVDTAQRLDEVHAKVDSGNPTDVTIRNGQPFGRRSTDKVTPS
jgi:hypothetical protein